MNRIDQITDVPKHHLCTGCGGCVGICPKDALEMVSTAEGTLAPQIDESKCNECGLCLRVCPGYEVDLPEFQKKLFGELPTHPEIGNFLHTYAGYATDEGLRRMSQSGGVVSALLIHLIESGRIDGAVVTHWSKQDPLTPEAYIARTPEEILDAVGTKYCPVPVAATMKQILVEEGKFVVVGVSCQIHAMRKAAELKPELNKKVLAYFGLHCLCVFNRHFFDFILGKRGIAREDVKRFDYRSKAWRGWPGDMRIETHSGHLINIPLVYSKLTPKPYFTPWRCLICPDKLNELSDISFGDCRIARVYEQQTLKSAEYGENPGQSDIICRTPEGNVILEEALAADVIQVQSIDWKEVLNTAMVSEKKLSLLNLKIFSIFFRMGFPSYNVAYYPKSRRNRLLFSLFHIPSLLNSFLSFLFHCFGKYRWFQCLLHICPLKLLRVVTLLHKKTANYHIFRRSGLVAVYHTTDSDNTPTL